MLVVLRRSGEDPLGPPSGVILAGRCRLLSQNASISIATSPLGVAPRASAQRIEMPVGPSTKYARATMSSMATATRA